MKKGLIVIASLFLILTTGGSSIAAPITGGIWQITGYNAIDQSALFVTYQANSAALATFEINTINFDSQALAGSYGSSVTYSQFLSNSLAGAPGPNGLVWKTGLIANNAILTDNINTSFFQFHGFANFSESFSIRHDDGMVLFIDGYQHIYDASYPTAPEVSNFSLSTYNLTPGTHEFILNYAAWNGFPEVLQMTSGVSVPEPTTMLLLGLGLVGLAGIRRKL